MKNLILRLAACAALALSCFGAAQAANFYWRANAFDNNFNDTRNWETSPGNLQSPITSPNIGDDVFFLVPSNIGDASFDPIYLNGGNCRDFHVTTTTGSFFFSGNLTGIYGSLNCPNGNANFSFNNAQNFNGVGNHFINMGTSAQRISGGRLLFANISNAGTYTLQSPLNTASALEFQSQNFISNGYPISGISFNISGTTPKTIDLGTSVVTISTTNNGGSIFFDSPHTSTSYLTSNADLVLNHISVNFNSGISLTNGVLVTLDEVTINTSASSNNTAFIEARGNTVALTALTTRILHLNTANLALGRTGFIATNTGAQSEGVLNIGTLELLQPCTISNDKGFTLNLGAIVEPSLCRGQSAFISQGASPIQINPSTPIATTSIAYYGTVVGGSGITASGSYNLGNNSGLFSWGGAAGATTFWWVGGAGNWEDPTQWSVLGSGGAPQSASGCIPTLADDVFFDAASFSGTQSVTIGMGNGFCKSITWTGSNQGSLLGGDLVASVLYAGNLYVNGSANFAGANVVGANLFLIGSGSHTLTSPTQAYTSPAIRVLGSGTYTLANPLRMSSSLPLGGYFQHAGGTFNAAGQTMHVDHFCSRSLPELASNVRTLDITNTEINIHGSTNLNGRRNIDLSFLTSLSAAGSHFKLDDVAAATYFGVFRGNASPSYLSTCNLNDISFTATSGTPTLSWVGIAGLANYTVNFNNVNFASNATIAGTSAVVYNNVNNYNLTSGRTYFFTSSTNQPYNVLTGINTVLTGCQDLVRIQSVTPGTQAKIFKAAAPFNVNGAIVTDINATGQTMNVMNGVNAGNNTNVTVSIGAGRTMYWVGDNGNWSDGLGHWSIGQSGGNPAVNNPLGCIPRAIDDVVFDLNSFTQNNRAVTLDIDGNCRNMLWTAAAGARIPAFKGISTINLNVYGSLELGTGMKSSFAGKTYMQGNSMVANSQSIDMNGVSGKGSIWLNGGGRYDLLDSVRIDTLSNGLYLVRGDFRSHGQSIYASALQLDVRGSNAADISNSKIRLFESGTGIGLNVNTAYIGRHDATGVWNATGSILQSDMRAVSIVNTAPVTYGHVVMTMSNTDADLTGSNTQPVTFRNVTWTRSVTSATGTFMSGIFTIDTLRYAKSSFNTLQPGGLLHYTIQDTLIATGTPCNPAYIRSATVGSVARLHSNRCNFDLNFVNLRELNATTCTAAQNKAIGADEGGNTNWTISSITGVTSLGNDTAIVCNNLPLSISAASFGSVPGMTYAWNTGATSSSISTTAAGTYAVTVTYANNCSAVDTMRVTCSSVFPIEELWLHGVAEGAVNQLDWQHAAQADVAQYRVERSLDGRAFAPIGQLTVAQNAGLQSMQFTDVQPVETTQYYRLQVVRRNGEIAFSNTVEITRGAGPMISTHPNPTSGVLTVTVSGMGPQSVAVLYNASGQPVAQYTLQNGNQPLDLGLLPSALYTLVVRDAQGLRHSARVQVQR